MKIPRKISPDNLTDSIVQILFNPGIAYELAVGAFYFSNSENFTFVGTLPQNSDLKIESSSNITLPIAQVGGFFLDKTNKVKVTVNPTFISFNSYKEYIGWEKYSAIIFQAIQKSIEIGLIKEVTRISSRYISQYENIDLFEKLKINFSIDIGSKNLNSTQIRNEFTDDSYKIYVNVVNNLTVIQNNSAAKSASLIDIDVIRQANFSNPDEMMQKITELHQKQKEIFFSILTESFLNELNPEY